MNNSLTLNTWSMAIIRHNPGRLKAAVKSKQLSSRRLYCHVKQRAHMKQHRFGDTLSLISQWIWMKSIFFLQCLCFGKAEITVFQLLTRPSALGKSDPFGGPSNPRYLFTKDYTIFCGPSNPQYLFPKDYAIFFWQIIDINKKFCTVSINFLLQLFKSFSFLG